MATDDLIAAARAYENAFGAGSAEELAAVNFLGNPRLREALNAAVASGTPLALAQLEAQLGETAFVEWGE